MEHMWRNAVAGKPFVMMIVLATGTGEGPSVALGDGRDKRLYVETHR